jgi:hypothetical protein
MHTTIGPNAWARMIKTHCPPIVACRIWRINGGCVISGLWECSWLSVTMVSRCGLDFRSQLRLLGLIRVNSWIGGCGLGGTSFSYLSVELSIITVWHSSFHGRKWCSRGDRWLRFDFLTSKNATSDKSPLMKVQLVNFRRYRANKSFETRNS